MVQKTSEFSKMFRKHNDFHTVFSNKITSQSLLSKFIRSLIDCNITLTFLIKRIEGFISATSPEKPFSFIYNIGAIKFYVGVNCRDFSGLLMGIISMGKSCKWVIGLHRKPAPILTRSKKDRPDDPFSVKFFRRPAGRPDKKLSVHSPIYVFLTTFIWIMENDKNPGYFPP